MSVRNVTRRFGGIVAIDSVSLDVEPGQIVGLIGPNGAGKTTLFNVITRLYRPDAGELDFAGRTLLRTPPHRIVRRGIARTFQNVELFRTMTVLDNVLVGAHTRSRPFGGRRAVARAGEILDYVGLSGVARRPVSALPFGTLKRVELARALVAEPDLLLLDEPAGGLNHEEVSELGEFTRKLQGLRPDGAPRRAPHGAGDGYRRPHARARLRTEDRRGHAGRGAAEPGGDRGVPR